MALLHGNHGNSTIMHITENIKYFTVWFHMDMFSIDVVVIQKVSEHLHSGFCRERETKKHWHDTVLVQDRLVIKCVRHRCEPCLK